MFLPLIALYVLRHFWWFLLRRCFLFVQQSCMLQYASLKRSPIMAMPWMSSDNHQS
jgi:hypothetical protein